MKKMNWLVVVIVGFLALLVLFGAGMFEGWGYRNWGYHGWGMMGPGGMMSGWGYSPLGWVGMLFMWLIPVSFIVLTVFALTWLVRNIGNNTTPSTQSPCPNCGKGTQADWQNCPYCGAALK